MHTLLEQKDFHNNELPEEVLVGNILYKKICVVGFNIRYLKVPTDAKSRGNLLVIDGKKLA